VLEIQTLTAETDQLTYTDLVKTIEAPLRRAMIATYGTERGTEAAAEALAYAWEHWDHIGTLANPVGYLYKVGRSKAIDVLRRPKVLFPGVPQAEMPRVEPGLPRALARLSRNQRVAVWLIHGYGCRYQEVADILGTSIGSVQKHVDRALRKLRTDLEVTDHD
jgi:DNA-directed RNA polymerase specialized sigma24 family protein